MLTMKNWLMPLILLIIFISEPTFAAKYYKWVDQEGVTHYGENPPDTATAKVINVSSGTPSDQQQAVESLEQSRKDKRDKAASEDPNAKINAQNKEIMERNCKLQNQNLAQMKANSRIKETSESGVTRYLNEEEIAARRAEIENYIKENCSG